MRALIAVLLLAPFWDEAFSGVPGLASPDIERAFGVSAGMASGWLLAAMMAGALVEPLIYLAADRWPRRWFLRWGYAGLAMACVGAAIAPNYVVLVASLALFGVASGTAINLSQAALMDARPDDRERLMGRWALLGVLGDLATPLAFVLAVWAGGDWRVLLLAGGAAFGAMACLPWRRLLAAAPAADAAGHAPHVIDADAASDREDPSVRDALRTALATPALLLWAAALVLCSPFDEILVAFGALHLDATLGIDAATRGWIFAVGLVGMIVGLLLFDRLIRRVAPLPLLAVACALGAAAYAAWLHAPTVVASAALLAVALFAAAAMYPIVMAQAYRALPGRSGTVLAIASVFGWCEIALPAALALVADAFGLPAAMWLLLAQPVGLLVITIVAAKLPMPRTTEIGPDP